MPHITLQGQVIEYSIRKSKRAKRINMKIDVNKGLEVIYPIGINQPTASEILQQNQAWVLATLDKMQSRKDSQVQRRYAQGEIFRYLGEDKHLNLIEKSHGKRISVTLADDTLDVSLPPNVNKNDTEAIRDAIEKFYRKQAKGYLGQRTQDIADKLGFDYNRITIKHQKTRWGSCSTNKNLNFNLRLMMAPPDGIDYIIIHELCHLVHMNHSKAFWNLVASYCPEYKYWRKWFKQNSSMLVL